MKFVSASPSNLLMSEQIVQSTTFLTLLGGAKTHFSHVNQSVNEAPILVAADGGADIALASGQMPDWVIGDMDSISAEAQAAIPTERQVRVEEQESTDLEKCLQRISAPLILAHGFLGDRLDHSLAACTALIRYPHQRCILFGDHDLCFLAPTHLRVDLPIGTRVSLFPMGPVSGQSNGLLYPIDGLRMCPGGPIGTSNSATGPVEIHFDARLMLVMVPLECREPVIRALVSSPPIGV